jgi:ubiquinone/menaquinone biosynthesis C-methylase UbiE
VDYDTTTIATTYDAARSYRPETLRQWLDIVAAHVPFAPRLIVDLGCGTGRYTQALADRFHAQVMGIDPSLRMLEAAQAKLGPGADVQLRCASAEKLPLADRCADVIFMSMVLHHVRDRPAMARECRRILRDGGRLCVRNATRNTLYPQSRFFPGMLAMMHGDLPSDADVIALFEAAGLRSCAHQPVQQAVAASWQELADKLALRADSFLARLPDAEFEAGIAAMRAYAEARPPEEIMERVDFFVFERP